MQHKTFYVDPSLLRADMARLARPGETDEMFKERVARMRTSIQREGQLEPMLVSQIPGSDPAHYDVYSGASRLAAILAENKDRKADEKMMALVMVTEGVEEDDARRHAIVSNLKRDNYSPLMKAQVLAETARVKGFTGKSTAAKLADYFGLGVDDVRQHLKLIEALSPDLLPEVGRSIPMETALVFAQIPDHQAQLDAYSAAEQARSERVAAQKEKGKVTRKEDKIQPRDAAKGAAVAGKEVVVKIAMKDVKELVADLRDGVWYSGHEKEKEVRAFFAAFAKYCESDPKTTDTTVTNRFSALLGIDGTARRTAEKAAAAAAAEKAAAKKAKAKAQEK